MSTMLCHFTRITCGLLFIILVALPAIAAAQPQDDVAEAPGQTLEEPLEAPDKVDVDPMAEDVDIAGRLRRILEATEWFREPTVQVDEGVVFLGGQTGSEEHRAWATKLAASTQDVVAVVNRIQVDVPSFFDFSVAWAELRSMTRGFVQSTPTIIASLLMLLFTWIAAKFAARIAKPIARKRIATPLLGDIVSKAVSIPVFLVGAYMALRISGLTQLAATVLGGTGLLGIVLGIAFRDIAENFLASVLISVQRPFIAGDLVTIDGKQGFVQAVTTRGTQLMTPDGNHVQIPNSLVYKSVIENASANPNLRLSFVVGIDYGDSATDAQSVVLESLHSHEAVLADPEPLVLIEDLATSTVNLRVYFWINGEAHSMLKVRSAILRRVKQTLQKKGFTLPDESREMIFPHGVPVQLIDPSANGEPSQDGDANRAVPPAEESDSNATAAEGGLKSDRSEIDQQAALSRPLEAGSDLLQDEH